MPDSPFTADQQKTLKEDFLPDYLALESDAARNAHLTTIIGHILKHDNFRDKLGPHKTEKAWKVCLSKFFKNRRQTQRQQQIRQELNEATTTSATKPVAHDPVNCVKGMRQAVKLFQVLGNENIDGQGFFKARNEERIREHASNMDGNPTANFKKAWKELWDAEPDKASYESQAREYWNVPNNQLQFLVGASRLLTAVCEFKHLGNVELMLMYTFCREDGSYDSGCISGHSDPETTDFSDEHSEAYQSFLEAWSKYGEKHCRIPDPSLQQTRFTIPVDSSGRPRFPELDFEKVTGEELREVLSVYFNALWAAARRKGRPMYTNIKNNPDSFIDSTIHKLPCFGNPHEAEFTRSMVIQLAEYLSAHSSVSAVQPFEFLADSDHVESHDESGKTVIDNPGFNVEQEKELMDNSGKDCEVQVCGNEDIVVDEMGATVAPNNDASNSWGQQASVADMRDGEEDKEEQEDGEEDKKEREDGEEDKEEREEKGEKGENTEEEEEEEVVVVEEVEAVVVDMVEKTRKRKRPVATGASVRRSTRCKGSTSVKGPDTNPILQTNSKRVNPSDDLDAGRSRKRSKGTPVDKGKKAAKGQTRKKRSA